MANTSCVHHQTLSTSLQTPADENAIDVTSSDAVYLTVQTLADENKINVTCLLNVNTTYLHTLKQTNCHPINLKLTKYTNEKIKEIYAYS